MKTAISNQFSASSLDEELLDVPEAYRILYSLKQTDTVASMSRILEETVPLVPKGSTLGEVRGQVLAWPLLTLQVSPIVEFQLGCWSM